MLQPSRVKRRRIPIFRSLADWLAVTPGQARLAMAEDRDGDGPALRLDFDFAGGAGFVVARRPIRLRLPEAFELRFRCRTTGPANKLELKLVAADGKSVWRHEELHFSVPESGWVSIRSEDIAFAWGPAGGGSPRSLSAIEIALAAEAGGDGSVWLSDLTCLDRSLPRRPLASASSEGRNHPAAAAVTARGSGGWRPLPTDRNPWWKMDLGNEFTAGGVVIHWAPRRIPARAVVQTSPDGRRCPWAGSGSRSDLDPRRSRP